MATGAMQYVQSTYGVLFLCVTDEAGPVYLHRPARHTQNVPGRRCHEPATEIYWCTRTYTIQKRLDFDPGSLAEVVYGWWDGPLAAKSLLISRTTTTISCMVVDRACVSWGARIRLLFLQVSALAFNDVSLLLFPDPYMNATNCHILSSIIAGYQGRPRHADVYIAKN